MLGFSSHNSMKVAFSHNKSSTLYGATWFLLGNHRLLVKKDEKAAFKYFLKSSLAGFIPATAVVAFFFEFSLARITPDYQTNYQVAEKLYTFAAKEGSGLAQARLAFLKTHGRPQIKIDQALAETYRKACGQQGALSVAWLAQAAEAGLAPAQFCLALCYYNGIAVPEDDTAAFKFCERAAAQGHPGAQNVLGNLYVEGAGCEVNTTIGLRWYIKAAEARESAAIYNIGTLFERGLAVEEDPNQAFQWYVRAAMFGSINAQNVLGIFYEQGIGIGQNPQLAVQNYTKAALSGHPHAQYNLGRCHHDGFGADRNDRLAAQWFEMAAQQNHALSQLSMGVCYEHGIGVPANRKQAIIYYKRAADNDCHEARRRLQPIIAHQILVPARILLAGRMKPFHLARQSSCHDSAFSSDDIDTVMDLGDGGITPPNEIITSSKELIPKWSIPQPELVSVQANRPQSYVHLFSSPPLSNLSSRCSARSIASSEDDEMDVDPQISIAGPTPPPTPKYLRKPTSIINATPAVEYRIPNHPSLLSSFTSSTSISPIASSTSETLYSHSSNNNLKLQPTHAGLYSLPVELLEYILSFLDPHQILTPLQRRLCCSIAGDRRSLLGSSSPLSQNTSRQRIHSGMDISHKPEVVVPQLSKEAYLSMLGCPVFIPRCECSDVCGQIKHIIAQFESHTD